MNELTIFKNEKFGEVRTITIEGEPWFVVADVCSHFGVSNRNRVMQSVDDEDKGGTQMDTPGGIQKVAIVNESGLYSLLFALQPAKARGVDDAYIEERQNKLREFKRWITHDVIPAIRKHGGYIAGEEHMDDEQLLAQAVLVAQRKLEERTAQLEAANKKIEKLEPKAAYFDTVASADGSTSFRETAKLFKIAEKTFTKFIEENNLCYRDSRKRLIPYAERQKSGWFEVKEVTITTSTGIKTTIYTKITPKGRTEIFKRLQTAGVIKPWETEVIV